MSPPGSPEGGRKQTRRQKMPRILPVTPRPSLYFVHGTPYDPMDLGRAGVHTAARVLILADPGARARSIQVAAATGPIGGDAAKDGGADGADDDGGQSSAQERQSHLEALQRNADSASDALALHCLQTIRAILGANAPPAIMELTRTESVRFLSSTRQVGATSRAKRADESASRIRAHARAPVHGSRKQGQSSSYDCRPALSRVTTQRMGSALLAVTAASEIRFAQHLRANPPRWTVGASLEVSGTEVPEGERILKAMRADAATKAGLQLSSHSNGEQGVFPGDGDVGSSNGASAPRAAPAPRAFPPKSAATASRPARGQTPLLAFLLQQPKTPPGKLDAAGTTQSRAHHWPAVDLLRQMLVFWKTKSKYTSKTAARSRE